ncbi:ZAR1-like protein [Peromyscus californicus insignis]|uniref:ZAR1-like protein n=1 Tax=Peromyscus californicus insignis TaxID=564181 RepID=UPI0022A7A566|nr:ZAR1-like protein [Peromyscus californicus insignis]
MEGFVKVPYSFHQGYGSTLPLSHPGLWRHCKQQDWRQNMGPPVFLARPGPTIPASASESCMYPYKRAQLQAILTQMNPNLSLRLCKANTKDVAVQVSLRVDKSVQCSLGPQTLYSSSLWDRTSLRKPTEAYWRRALIQLPKDEEHRESQELAGCAEARPHTPKPDGDKQENLPQLKEVGEEDAPSPRKSKLFLEPKYGYFHCKDCKTRWESAYVWCISGTNKVYFKQLCCKCQKKFNPYRVEAIQCQTCSKSCCSCPQRKRHIDIRRPHRQELCGRCKDKRFSCSNVYIL